MGHGQCRAAGDRLPTLLSTQRALARVDEQVRRHARVPLPHLRLRLDGGTVPSTQDAGAFLHYRAEAVGSEAMSSYPCPHCRQLDGRLLQAGFNDVASVHYYRCDRCGHVWTIPKNQPDAVPTSVTSANLPDSGTDRP